MVAVALALVMAGVITLVAGTVPNPYVSVFELVGITGFYTALFVGAGWLLRTAAQEGGERGQ
jgi:cytochrome bd-type quinol oxidase subunit 1